MPLFKGTSFFYPIRLIGRALKLLLTLDCIINENIFYDESLIKQHWRKYRDAFKLMKITPDKYGVSIDQLKSLERIIVKVDKGVMTGESLNFFLGIINDPSKIAFFEEIGDIKSVKTNKVLLEVFKQYFKDNLRDIELNLGTE